jgi:hypothetical protein
MGPMDAGLDLLARQKEINNLPDQTILSLED